MSKQTRFWSGTNALVVLLAGVGIVVLINVLGTTFYVRGDLTAQHVHTLSDASIQAVRALDDLEVQVFISANLPAEVQRMGRTLPLKGIDRKFLDKLAEYESHSDGKLRLVRVSEDIERKAEAASLQLFSADEAKVQSGGRLEFTRYALGASFHYRNVSEVFPLALEPEHYEFEITRILVRLKEKYEEGRLMDDILTAGDAVFTAVKECNDTVSKYTSDQAEQPKEGAGLNPLIAGAEKSQQRLANLRGHREDLRKTCDSIVAKLNDVGAKLRGRNPDLDALMGNIAQYAKYFGRFDQIAGSADDNEAQQAFRAGQVLNQLFGVIEQAYQGLKSAPGRKTIGLLCGHDEFCPFPSEKPLIDAQIAGMLGQKNPLAQHFIQQASGLEEQINRINQQINQGLFRTRGFDIRKIGKGDAIGTDVDALILFGPSKPLEKKDLFEVDQFLLSGRPVIVLLKQFDVALANMGDDESLDQTALKTTDSNVSDLLAAYGIVAHKDLVMEPRANASVTVMHVEKQGRLAWQSQRDYAYPLLPTFTDLSSEHVLVKGLSNLTLPYVSSLEVTPDLAKRKDMEVVELVRSSPNAVTMSRDIQLVPPLLMEQLERQAPTGKATVALFVKGRFDSYFKSAKIEELPVKAREAGSDLMDAAMTDKTAPATDEKKDEKAAPGGDTPREFRRAGQGRLLVIGSNLGLESLSPDVIFAGFNMAGLTEANMDVLKDLKKYAIRFQNWQLRIGQIGQTIQETLQFLFNVMDWAVQKDSLVEIRSKGYVKRPLTVISADQQTAFALTAVVFWPILFIGFGVTRFLVRRRRKLSL